MKALPPVHMKAQRRVEHEQPVSTRELRSTMHSLKKDKAP